VSDRATADRPGADLPTEQVPALRGDDPPRLPVIVPAVNDPEPAPAESPGSVSAGSPAGAPTATAWVEDAQPPLIVATPTQRRRGRDRVRRVTRTIRHVDPWSTFKVALICSLVLYGVAMTSGVLLWNVALRTGTIANIERWFTQFGWESFELNGGEIYHNAWIAGLFVAVGLTGVAVLMATVFNLVSDIVGGVGVTVLEDEVVEVSTSARRTTVSRPASTDPQQRRPPGPRAG